MNFAPIIVIPGLMVLAVMCLMAMFARLYRKAGPHGDSGGLRSGTTRGSSKGEAA